MRALWFVSDRQHRLALESYLDALGFDGALTELSASTCQVAPSCDCVSFTVPDAAGAALQAAASDAATDVLCVAGERPRLALFDMDSTLIQHEVIDELAAQFGLGEQVSAITERAMRGELDFVQSFTERLGLLAGLAESELDGVYQRLQLMPGAQVLMPNLSHAGLRLGIVSGGFSYFADQIGARLGMDFVLSNTLQCADGAVTGQVVLPVIDGSMKEATLRSEAKRLGLSLAHTLAVGDGANDIPMLKASGIGVAFRAKPKVQAESPNRLNHQDLSALSYLGML